MACGLCYVGLSYVAWGWPSVDGYPAIERFLDPSFLREDFYTNTSESYGAPLDCKTGTRAVPTNSKVANPTTWANNTSR